MRDEICFVVSNSLDDDVGPFLKEEKKFLQKSIEKKKKFGDIFDFIKLQEKDEISSHSHPNSNKKMFIFL